MGGYTLSDLLMSNRQFLELHGSQWRVTVPVPKQHQARLGKTRMKRPLGTDSLKEANVLKWRVIAEIKAEINGQQPELRGSVRDEAFAFRMALARARLEEREGLLDAVSDRAEAIAGPIVGEDERTGETLHDEAKERDALAFLRIARGEATPWDDLVENYHGQKLTKDGTKADDKLALRRLKEWCLSTGVEPVVEEITRKVAGAHIAAMVDEGRHPATINKQVSRLASFWRWMVNRGVCESANPWLDQRLDEPESTEREFTDEEVRALLKGPKDKPPSADLLLLIKIGALTGARIDAIASLRAKGCRDGVFTFKPMKKEKKAREVPIHSAIAAEVARRVSKLPDDAFLFEVEWPSVRSGKAEASHAPVKAFVRYRKACGVDEQEDGKRRSNVNYHSFRRWFATKAEQAGFHKSLIERVTGHKPTGEALGTYSGGASLAQKREVVEAVRLPDL